MEQLIERLKNLYSALDANQCTEVVLGEIYADSILFQDPFHNLDGLPALVRYMKSMYEGVEHCQFTFFDQIVQGEQCTLIWQMGLRHPKLNGGQLVTVDGVSIVKGSDKIYYHRDYFDGGQLLYEHIPLLGRIVKMLKKHLAKEAQHG